MAGYNRHLRGDSNEMLVKIHGNIVVNAGDLMFLDRTNGGRGAGEAADYYAYPFNYALNATTIAMGIASILYNHFAGVAMDGSESGTTEDISVATNGVFRYPVYREGAVTIGALVSAVSSFTSGTGVSPQTVYMANSAPGSTAYLGYCVKTQSGASYVDFQIRTAYGAGGLAT